MPRLEFAQGLGCAIALTIAAAGIYSLSFPPWSLAPAAWIALAPLLVAVAHSEPRRAAGLGMLFGIGVAYGTGGCLPDMVSTYFEQPIWVGWAVFAVVAVGLAGIYFAAFAAWVSWAARRGLAGPLSIPAAWGVCELARARLIVGNPWALLGYSQVQHPTLMQIADLAGPYGVGMLLAAIGAVLAGLAAPSLRRPHPWRSAFAVAASVCAVWIYGTWRLSQDFGSEPPLTIAAVQGALHRDFRWHPEYQRLGLEEYLSLTRTAAAAQAPDLVVWPEYAVNFYVQEAGPDRTALLSGLRDIGSDVILGGPHYAFGEDRTFYHNSVFLVREDDVAARYDKLELLPLAEADLPANLGSIRPTPLSAGDGATLMPSRRGPVGAFLCFEAMYPELVRRFALGGATILANLTNDDWFGREWAARHHLAIASVRAIENRRPLVRAASTGISAIIDAHGRIVAEGPFRSPTVLTAAVSPSSAVTPYQRWGDAPVGLGFLVIGAWTLVGLRRGPE